MTERIPRRSLALVFGIELAVMLGAYVLFATRAHFSCDSYINYYVWDFEQHQMSGRLVSLAVLGLEYLLGFNPVHHQAATALLFALACAGLATWLEAQVLAARRTHHAPYLVASSLCVAASLCNVFFWEWYTFTESACWYAVALALGMGCVWCLGQPGRMPGAVALAALAMMAYQVVIPMVFVWRTLVVLAGCGFCPRREDARELARATAACAGGAALGLAAPRALAALGMLGQGLARSGISRWADVAANLQALANLQRDYWIGGCNFLPRWSAAAFLVVGLSLWLAGSLRHRQGTGALGFVAALALCYAASLCLHLVVEEAYFSPRTLAPIGCVWSVLWLACVQLGLDTPQHAWAPQAAADRTQPLLAQQGPGRAERSRHSKAGQPDASGMAYAAHLAPAPKKELADGARPHALRPPVRPAALGMAATLAVAFFLALNVHAIHGATRAHFAVNDADAAYAAKVLSSIERYERETGVTITQLAYADDMAPTYAVLDSERYTYYGANASAVPVRWALPYLIQYCSGRSLDFRELKDTERDALFGAQRDDTAFDESQVRCEGSTAYLLVY